MQSADLQVIKEIPGYKVILKAVLKTQIQQLVEQLADHTGEESVILTASVSDGSLSHLGSESGKVFLEDHDDIKSQFLGFCLKRFHQKIQIEKQIEEETQQPVFSDPGGRIRTPGGTPQRFGSAQRARYTATGSQSSPRQVSPLQGVPSPSQAGIHPVSLTRASPQSSGRGGRGQRHQPYPSANQARGSKLNKKLPAESTQSENTGEIPTKIIKIEPLEESEGTKSTKRKSKTSKDTGDTGSNVSSVSGTSESNDSYTENTQDDDETSQAEPTESDTAIVKAHTQGEGLPPEGLSSDSDMSGLTGQMVSFDTDQRDNIKAEGDEMDLEITGMEQGQMAPTDSNWMSNVQAGMAYDSSVAGPSNIGQSEAEYVAELRNRQKQCSVCGKYIRKSSMPNHMKLHTGERSYFCTLCEKSFVQKSNYLRHMFRKHNQIL